MERIENLGSPKISVEEFQEMRAKVATGKMTIEDLKNPRIPLVERNALAFDLARRLEAQVRDLEERLAIDAKTTLMNDAFLESTVSNFLKQLNFEGESDLETVMVLYLDIDDFGEINNTYGHQAGDDALRVVAQNIKEVVKYGDPAFLNTPFRPGGDEFLIVMPIYKTHGSGDEQEGEVNLDSIFARVKERMNNLSFKAKNPKKEGEIIDVPVRLSTGRLVVKRGDNITVGEVVSGADKEMYIEKRKKKQKFEQERRRPASLN